jgi:TonB family protein
VVCAPSARKTVCALVALASGTSGRSMRALGDATMRVLTLTRSVAALCVVALVACAVPAVRMPASNDYYPRAARRSGQTARVLVEFRIGEAGKPSDIKFLRSEVADSPTDGGHRVASRRLFERSAEKFVATWRFPKRSRWQQMQTRRRVKASLVYSLEPCNAAHFPDAHYRELICSKRVESVWVE